MSTEADGFAEPDGDVRRSLGEALAGIIDEPQPSKFDPRLLAILQKAVGEWGLCEVARAAAWMAGPPEGPA